MVSVTIVSTHPPFFGPDPLASLISDKSSLSVVCTFYTGQTVLVQYLDLSGDSILAERSKDKVNGVTVAASACLQHCVSTWHLSYQWWIEGNCVHIGFPPACHVCPLPHPPFLPPWPWVLRRPVRQSPAASHLAWGRGSLSRALWTPSSSPARPPSPGPAARAAHGEARWDSVFLGVSLRRGAWLPRPWACRRSVWSGRRVGVGAWWSMARWWDEHDSQWTLGKWTELEHCMV